MAAKATANRRKDVIEAAAAPYIIALKRSDLIRENTNMRVERRARTP